MVDIDIRNSTGTLDPAKLGSALDVLDEGDPRRDVLLRLIRANNDTCDATVRHNVAQKRYVEAVANEEITRNAAQEAASPFPIGPVLKKLEEQLGRPLREHEIAEAKVINAHHVRAHREAEMRRAHFAANR